MNETLVRSIIYLLRKIGRRTLLIFSLLGVALASLVYALADMLRNVEAGLLLPLALLGLLAGWLLARSRLRTVWALPALTLLGAGLVAVRVGQLGGELLRLLLALNNFITDALHWYPGAPGIDPVPLSQTTLEFNAGLTTLFTRLVSWLQGALGGAPAFDPAAIALLWSLGVWIVAAWAAWTQRRWRQPLLALLPTAVFLGASLAVTRGETFYLVPLLASGILLIAITSYTGNLQRWQSSGTDYSEDLGLDISIAVVLLVAVLTFSAAVSPAFSLRRLADLLERWSAERRAAASVPRQQASGGGRAQPVPSTPNLEAFGLRPNFTPTPRSPLIEQRYGGLPRSHLLGSGPELSEEIVLRIDPGVPDGQAQPAPTRYYWRTLTYDRYTGAGWITSPVEQVSYAADGWTARPPALQPAPGDAVPAGQRMLEGEQVLNLQVETVGGGAGGLAVSAGELLQIDQPYTAGWRRRPAGSVFPPDADLFGATLDAGEYAVTSLFPQPGEAQLRSAGENYPDWVLNDFLILPQDLPDRVRSLARDLTATEPTTYDRAKAIERYLRQFPYTLDLPAPPPDRDIVDYFLFDLQTGYCDYYASSMVVLARAAGLPARLAIGYASGKYDPEQGRYVVSQAEAHAWPEVFFPGYGWVAFEPTAGQPALERSSDAQRFEVPALANEGAQLPPLPDLRPLLLGLAGLLGALALAWIAWLTFDLLRLFRLPPQAALARLYARLRGQALRLDAPLAPGDTPYEFAAALSGQLAAPQGRLARFIQPADDETQQLVELYAQAAYSPRPPGPAEQRRAIRTWLRLLPRLRLAGWRQRAHRFSQD